MNKTMCTLTIARGCTNCGWNAACRGTDTHARRKLGVESRVVSTIKGSKRGSRGKDFDSG